MSASPRILIVPLTMLCWSAAFAIACDPSAGKEREFELGAGESGDEESGGDEAGQDAGDGGADGGADGASDEGDGSDTFIPSVADDSGDEGDTFIPSDHDDSDDDDSDGETGDDTDHDDDCVRTQGYWKNHHSQGKGKNQTDPWPLDEGSEICGELWLDIFNTSPQGNAFYILAHQWMAASLNVAAGTIPSAEVAAALDAAGVLLEGCEIAADDRAQAIEWSGLLDAFNNGNTDHECDDTDDDAGDEVGGEEEGGGEG